MTIPYFPMPTITITWDLFIIVFFAIVMSYSFIIGRTQSVKVIVATYVAIIATQGLGNVIARLSGESQAAMQIMGMALQFSMLSGVKIFLFAFFIIVLAVRSGITITQGKEDDRSIISMVFTGLYGFGTAGLIVSTILTYATGRAILDMGVIAPELLPLVQSSKLLMLIMLNQDLWFTLPALLIIGAGFIREQ